MIDKQEYLTVDKVYVNFDDKMIARALFVGRVTAEE